MCDDNKDVKLSLKVLVNKARKKVLFAEADSQFADILLSFLTLPLGRIVNVLLNHYGAQAPNIGSLTSLHYSLAILDVDHFWTCGAWQILLNPTSSFEDEYKRLRIDISYSQPAEYFYCTSCSYRFRSESMYYDRVTKCLKCRNYCSMEIKEVGKRSEAASSHEVFTDHKSSFIISDDLQILPNDTGLVGIINILGITDMDKAEPIAVDFGLSEIMDLLKASFTSQTPLSDIILNRTCQMNSAIVDSQPMITKEDNLNDTRNLSLKVMIQKSTGKFLYAQAKEDFVEFLFSLFHIPLGGAEHLLAGKTSFKAIDNLYRSLTDLIDDKYFKSTNTKRRLMKTNVPHGCISKDSILPLTENCLPAVYTDDLKWFSSVKFPNGHGSYLEGPRTYEVKDDLTVTPFCFLSILSSLKDQKIPTSDVKEMELQIGLKEQTTEERSLILNYGPDILFLLLYVAMLAFPK